MFSSQIEFIHSSGIFHQKPFHILDFGSLIYVHVLKITYYHLKIMNLNSSEILSHSNPTDN